MKKKNIFLRNCFLNAIPLQLPFRGTQYPGSLTSIIFPNQKHLTWAQCLTKLTAFSPRQHVEHIQGVNWQITVNYQVRSSICQGFPFKIRMRRGGGRNMKTGRLQRGEQKQRTFTLRRPTYCHSKLMGNALRGWVTFSAVDGFGVAWNSSYIWNSVAPIVVVIYLFQAESIDICYERLRDRQLEGHVLRSNLSYKVYNMYSAIAIVYIAIRCLHDSTCCLVLVRILVQAQRSTSSGDQNGISRTPRAICPCLNFLI